MQQKPLIRKAPEKRIVGISLEMSIIDNKTGELWKRFKMLQEQVINRIDDGYYSIQRYPENYFNQAFDPNTKFLKSAGVAVSHFEDDLPLHLDHITIPEGLWAVFKYKGTVEQFSQFAAYIYTQWLPESGYQIDDRPHYEYLSAHYLGTQNSNSEEDVWIPIR